MLSSRASPETVEAVRNVRSNSSLAVLFAAAHMARCVVADPLTFQTKGSPTNGAAVRPLLPLHMASVVVVISHMVTIVIIITIIMQSNEGGGGEVDIMLDGRA